MVSTSNSLFYLFPIIYSGFCSESKYVLDSLGTNRTSESILDSLDQNNEGPITAQSLHAQKILHSHMSSCLLGEDEEWGYLINYLFATVMSVRIICVCQFKTPKTNFGDILLIIYLLWLYIFFTYTSIYATFFYLLISFMYMCIYIYIYIYIYIHVYISKFKENK